MQHDGVARQIRAPSPLPAGASHTPAWAIGAVAVSPTASTPMERQLEVQLQSQLNCLGEFACDVTLPNADDPTAGSGSQIAGG